ncbi:Aminodeoxychorismate lyase [hydrothermal vent metagenome]|uniref:aminodeoxychorismate lyase n=1 Tax=hydrothermal vent metagenome TaxID=652676 RepID=A0A3B0WP45_9ZZZZ
MNKVIINGNESTTIDIHDRGFQYGDGLFETIAYKKNKLQLANEHFKRLRLGCERLSLTGVDESLWFDDIEKCQLKHDSIIKLVVSRGVSARGYAFGKNNITRVTSSYPMPEYPLAYAQGITARICTTPISMNASLAGLKHLNRLDNVLARNEWNDLEITEGFMLDNMSNVIEGTMSNVFGVLNNELYTPRLEQCGIAGVIRSQVIILAKKMNIVVNIVDIKRHFFLQMDAVFITNSLIGLWPVKQIGDMTFQKHLLVTQLQTELFKCLDC